jgi:putative Mn2+ efflux pump MntP
MIVAVFLTNIILIFFGTFPGNWIKNLSRKFPSILSGIILIIIGILKFLELIF